MTWTGYFCICTAACGTWLSANNPDNIDFTGKTEGIDYLVLKVLNIEETETPDVNIKPIAKRKTLAAGLGKVELVLTITGYVTRRESGSESGTTKEKYNKIKSFCRRHDEMSDTAIYLVSRVRNVADTGWIYEEFEDDQGNYDRKYLKGKISGLVKKYGTYGYIEYKIQYAEAWLP